MAETTAAQPQTVHLDVTGMTCTMCAGHIARKLNKMGGVRASVDFSTSSAVVSTRGVTADALCEAISEAGYSAQVRSIAAGADDAAVDAGRHGFGAGAWKAIRQLLPK